ncbi:MAG: hypothetical protein COA47_18035 [Robiginitomaculum sp.]|nr:MAG: hypothetical protein COA47_18035 [Robiginitomaculum sp.]
MYARQKVVVQTGLSPLIALYLFFFLIPVELSFYIGPLLITPTRLFLILSFVPVMIFSFSNMKLRLEDYLFVLFVLWVSGAYFYKRGISGVEIAGQHFLEATVSYFVARTFLKTTEDILALAKWLTILISVLAFLAIPEAFSKYRFFHEVPEMITGFYYYISDDTRFGMLRAASTFEHPILFGLFASSMFILLWFSSASAGQRMWIGAVCLTATFFSLSSAAFLVLIMQFFFIFIERVTRPISKRMMIFTILTVSFILILEFGSNQGAIRFLIGKLTLNPFTAYYRLLQWEYSIDDVMRHPFVGIRIVNWTRPYWMTDSIDNHWLLAAMNSGMPSVALLWSAMVTILVKIYKAGHRHVDRRNQQLCLAWLIGISSLFMGGWTVAFFGKMLPIFMFFIGVGAAISRLENGEADDDKVEKENDESDENRQRFTRFENSRITGTVRNVPQNFTSSRRD